MAKNLQVINDRRMHICQIKFYLLTASIDPVIGTSDEPESYRTPKTSNKNPFTPLAIHAHVRPLLAITLFHYTCLHSATFTVLGGNSVTKMELTELTKKNDAPNHHNNWFAAVSNNTVSTSTVLTFEYE